MYVKEELGFRDLYERMETKQAKDILQEVRDNHLENEFMDYLENMYSAFDDYVNLSDLEDDIRFGWEPMFNSINLVSESQKGDFKTAINDALDIDFADLLSDTDELDMIKDVLNADIPLNEKISSVKSILYDYADDEIDTDDVYQERLYEGGCDAAKKYFDELFEEKLDEYLVKSAKEIIKNPGAYGIKSVSPVSMMSDKTNKRI